MVGHARFFHLPQLWNETFVHNFRGGLTRDNNTDVDFFLTFSPEDRLNDAVLKAAEALKPVSVLFFAEDHDARYLAPCDTKRDGFSFYPQFARVRRCFQQVVAHETSRDITYDAVVKVRPDEYFFLPLPPYSYFPHSEVTVAAVLVNSCGPQQQYYTTQPGFGTISDHFAFVPRQYAFVYFTAAEDISKCYALEEYLAACHVCNNNVPPECILTHHLLHHNTPVWVADDLRKTPVAFMTARADGERDFLGRSFKDLKQLFCTDTACDLLEIMITPSPLPAPSSPGTTAWNYAEV